MYGRSRLRSFVSYIVVYSTRLVWLLLCLWFVVPVCTHIPMEPFDPRSPTWTEMWKYRSFPPCWNRLSLGTSSSKIGTGIFSNISSYTTEIIVLSAKGKGPYTIWTGSCSPLTSTTFPSSCLTWFFLLVHVIDAVYFHFFHNFGGNICVKASCCSNSYTRYA